MSAKTIPAIAPEPLPYSLLCGPTEVAALYGVPESTLTKLVQAGALAAPVVKVGRIRRWNREQVLAMIGGQ